MIIKIDWILPNEHGFRMYHVYQCEHYLVDYEDLNLIHLYLDDDKHHLVLSNGDKAWIMNDSGKTIEVISTNSSILPVLSGRTLPAAGSSTNIPLSLTPLTLP